MIEFIQGRNKIQILFILIILLFSAVIIFYNQSNFFIDESENDIIEKQNHSNETNNTTKYYSIKLSSNFFIISNDTKSIPVLKMSSKNKTLNETIESVKELGFCYNDNKSSVILTNLSILFQNTNNSTYIDSNGYIEYNNRYSDYKPLNKSAINENTGFFNKSETQEFIQKYLMKKEIINSSWILHQNLIQYKINISSNNTVVLHYFFHYVPTYRNIPLIDSRAPYIIIRIDPTLTFIQLVMRECEIQEHSNEWEIRNATDVLLEIDINHTKFNIINNTTFYRMELCYRRNGYTGLELYPNWRITFGDNRNSFLYLEDYRDVYI